MTQRKRVTLDIPFSVRQELEEESNRLGMSLTSTLIRAWRVYETVRDNPSYRESQTGAFHKLEII